MQNMKVKVMTLAVLGALSVAGCNSGSSSTPTGTSAALARTGVITGFGSVFVNGVEYQSSSATVKANGVAADESKLAVGMVVKLKGSVNADGKTGTALDISYADELHGIVQAVAVVAGKGTLTVMGQTVNVDAVTVFESKVAAITSMDMIVIGNILEVSGYTAGDGNIYATRVEVKKTAMSSGDEIELKGLIASLDSTAKMFLIGNQSIDYSAANLGDIPNGTLVNDMYVEVKSTQGFNSSNVLLASKVELDGDGKNGVDATTGEDLELEGVVTHVASSTEFILNDQVVLLTDTTMFEHGTSASIAKGMRLEVEGAMNVDHKLAADKVKFREESNIEISAVVGAIDVAASSVTVLGQAIHIDNLTLLKDERDGIRYFSLKDMAVNDALEMHAYLDSSGSLVATQLKRKSTGSNVSQLHGTVTSVAGFVVVIAGVSVDLSKANLMAFGSVAPIAGSKVEVDGTFANNTLTATTIQKDD